MMNVGICIYEDDEYESVSLVEAARALGHQVTVFSLDDVRAELICGAIRVFAGPIAVQELSCVVFRGKFDVQRYLHSLDRFMLLEQSGVPLTERLDAYLATKSKVAMYLRMSICGVRIPETLVTTHLADIREFSERYGHVVIKPPFGYGGFDIEQIEHATFDDAVPLIEQRLKDHGNLVCQQFIPHPEGDYRMTVVGDDVLFCVRRIPNEKTWKANIAQGATGMYITPPQELVAIAKQATQACGLFVSGVDIVVDDQGPLVFEVNTTPGWIPLGDFDNAFIPQQIITRALDYVKSL